MKEQLISFETAKLAKERGFDEESYDCFNVRGMLFSNGWCESIFDDEIELPFSYKDFNYHQRDYILRPSQSLLQKWLREKYKIDITVITEWKKDKRYYRVGLSFINDENKIDIWFSKEKDNITIINYDYYEEALEIGLQEALKLIENGK